MQTYILSDLLAGHQQMN